MIHRTENLCHDRIEGSITSFRRFLALHDFQEWRESIVSSKAKRMSNNYPMSKLEIDKTSKKNPCCGLWMCGKAMITECKMLSFVCQDEAIEFAKWTVETDQSMRWPQNFDLSDQTPSNQDT